MIYFRTNNESQVFIHNMEHIVIKRKKLTKKKPQNGKSDQRSKRKQHKSAFENQIVKFGMNRIHNPSKIQTVHKRKSMINDKERLTTNQGIYAKSIFSKIARKHDFKYEEFKGRINCDLQKILKDNFVKETSHRKHDHLPIKYDLSTIVSEQEIGSCKSPNAICGITYNDVESVQSIKNVDVEPKIMLRRKRMKDIAALSTFNQNNVIEKALFHENPICTTFFYLCNPKRFNRNKKSSFGSDINVRFKFYLDGIINTVSDQCKKLNITVLSDTISTLKNIYTQSHYSRERHHKLIFDFDSVPSINKKLKIKEKKFDPDEFTVDTITCMNPLNMFLSEKEKNNKYMHEDKQYSTRNFEPNMRSNLYNFDHYSSTNYGFDYFEGISRRKQVTKSKFCFETPEYQYQKMNL